MRTHLNCMYISITNNITSWIRSKEVAVTKAVFSGHQRSHTFNWLLKNNHNIFINENTKTIFATLFIQTGCIFTTTKVLFVEVLAWFCLLLRHFFYQYLKVQNIFQLPHFWMLNILCLFSEWWDLKWNFL